jgi:Ureide permease
MFVGLILLLFTGASYILFSPAFNLATNDQFGVLRNNTHKLVVYTAFFWFRFTLLGCIRVFLGSHRLLA